MNSRQSQSKLEQFSGLVALPLASAQACSDPVGAATARKPDPERALPQPRAATGSPLSQPPPSARISATVAVYCAVRTCRA